MSAEVKRKAPAFQFYADDFLSGTITMSNEERGAYIALLCIQWSKGFVSQTDFDRIAMAMPPHSQAICQEKFQKDADGCMRNARLEKERQKQEAYRKKQAENANSRWHGNPSAMPPHMPEACSPSPSSSPTKDLNKDLDILSIMGTKVPKPRFKKPSLDDVKAEMENRGLPEIEAEKFMDFYDSNGWKVSRAPMADWKAAVRRWVRNNQERSRSYQPTLIGTSTPNDAPF